MIFKYKLQILEGIVYTKSSLTFLFKQTYKFLQTTKKKKKKKKKEKRKKRNKGRAKEKRKKVHFDGTPLCDCLLLSYQKKVKC